MATLGETIKAKRKKLKMSVATLALRCGMSKTYLYKVEANAYKTPSFELIDKFAKVLELDARILKKKVINVIKERIDKNENTSV